MAIAFSPTLAFDPRRSELCSHIEALLHRVTGVPHPQLHTEIERLAPDQVQRLDSLALEIMDDVRAVARRL